MPNRLTPLYFKIYYKEENYLKVKTVVFKYITPPYSKGWVRWYISILVYFMFLCSHIPTFRTLIIYRLYNLATPYPMALLVPSVPPFAHWHSFPTRRSSDLLNRLTLLYSKIYYKKENYLKVKTVVFKYITPPIVKVEYVGILVY